MAVPDRIRLTDLLRKKPWKQGFFYVGVPRRDAALGVLVPLGAVVGSGRVRFGDHLVVAWGRRFTMARGEPVARLAWGPCPEFRTVAVSTILRLDDLRVSPGGALVVIATKEGCGVDVIVERSSALDVRKASVTACVRVPDERGVREPYLAEFQTTVRGLLALRDWLVAHRVSQVVMEATGVCWKPVWHILEDDFELLLVNARHVKQVPGRKTDVSDAAWLCQLAQAGLLKGSFVPPKPVRAPRLLTRYRTTQIAERQREANRLHKALEDTNIKLDCVASDILGVSGRAMLDALVAGTTDPEILADLAKGRLRKKLPALRDALEGRFDRLHALLIGSILAHLDFLDEQIDGLSDAIEEQLVPFATVAVALPQTIPGVAERGARTGLGGTKLPFNNPACAS